jgi:hypothetical protein
LQGYVYSGPVLLRRTRALCEMGRTVKGRVD